MRPRALTPGLDALDDRAKLTAALSTSFDPLQLLDVESLLDDDRVEAVDGLAAVCDEVEVAGSGYPHWSMRPEARQHLLRTMADLPDFEVVLESIDIASDDVFAGYLRDGLRGVDLGTVLPPDGSASTLGTAELDCLLRAVRFLGALPGRRKPMADLEQRVRRQIAVTQADDALQAVAPARLFGREEEYAALRAYCTTPLPTHQEWLPTFVLVGPGGVGKSALVSTFIGDQRHQPGAAPLIYLDFDRASLIDAAPLDLTFEFTRQLALTEPSLDPVLAEFRERSRSLLGGRERQNIDLAAGASAGSLRDMATLLSTWPGRTAPLTIVLDTFEEVALRGVTAVRDVLQWAAELRNTVRLPQLHLIVSGREVMPDAPHVSPAEVAAMFNVQRWWPLEDLGLAQAIEMLTFLGIEPGLAQRFAAVFGGNPLVLKLIHRFVSTNHPHEVAQLLADGEKARRDAPAGEVGLRFVYERILNRIKKPRVKALAYPGVVLRRVTPELILKVLAPALPARLDVATPGEAGEVFTELAEHVWLVNRVAPDVVVHRADLRRLLVPGLERSADVDTRTIHRLAAAYYATRPLSVPDDIAEIEEIYHRGLLNDVPGGISEDQAGDLVRRLGADLEYWPLQARAMLKSLAGRHVEQTEEEVGSLAAAQQRITRGFRLEKGLSSSDLSSASFEEAQLEVLGAEDPDAGEAIPDSRWELLFDRGDFEFMTESSRVLNAFDRYFADPSRPPPSSPTHEHPWYIALASLIIEPGALTIFGELALAALQHGGEEPRRLAAALAALAGDRRSLDLVLGWVRRDLPPVVDLTSVDDVLVFQAAASRGDLDDRTTLQTYSFDQFRLSHVAALATAAEEHAVADQLTRAAVAFADNRPNSTEINRLREGLARAYIKFGVRDLRAAPTPLSFLYGLIRTVLDPLDRAALLQLVSELEPRSVFWPVDLTAEVLDPMLGATISPTQLTALVETADRCGLMLDLVDAASTRVSTRLALQVAAGIRRLEGLLFPFARPRADLANTR